MLNPHPTLIPAIEAGWVESVSVRVARSAWSATPPLAPTSTSAGPTARYAPTGRSRNSPATTPVDMFIGSTLQVDVHGNSSTVTKGRIAGFGGAPNMGCRADGPATRPRRRGSKAGRDASPGPGGIPGRKLGGADGGDLPVRQQADLRRDARRCRSGDRFGDGRGLPVMIYGDDVTHVVTEEGIANLSACRDDAERQAAIRAVAGYTPVGLAGSAADGEYLRDRGAVQRAPDLGVDPADASGDLLAATSIKILRLESSGGLYDPPAAFVDW